MSTVTILDNPARVDLDRTDPDAVLALLARHDLRGHGGAGFPTATKITSARGKRPRLVVNVCDGEPLVGKDGALVERSPGLPVDGTALVARLVGAREVVLAAHRGSATHERLTRLVATEPRLRRARVLAVPPRYVASEASALASLAAGGEARPVHHPAPLTTAGPGRGRVPVLVLNAETLARVAALVLDPEGTPTRLVTLAGDVGAPGLVEAPLSATVGDLVRGAGGATSPPRAVLLGGYGGQWRPWAEVAPLTLASVGPALGAGLLMVQGAGCPLPVVGRLLTGLAAESAGQCGPCVFGLPAVAADWAELASPGTADAAGQRLRRRLPVLRHRGACHHPDGVVGMAATAFDTFGAHLTGHRAGACLPVGPDATASEAADPWGLAVAR